MITAQDLLDADYVWFHDPTADAALEPYYRRSYQKWISDEVGRCYAITIRHGYWPANPQIANDQPKPFFAPSVQFTRGDTTFNVDLLHHHETVAEIEAFFADIWRSTEADYYESKDGVRLAQPLRSGDNEAGWQAL